MTGTQVLFRGERLLVTKTHRLVNGRPVRLEGSARQQCRVAPSGHGGVWHGGRVPGVRNVGTPVQSIVRAKPGLLVVATERSVYTIAVEGTRG